MSENDMTDRVKGKSAIYTSKVLNTKISEIEDERIRNYLAKVSVGEQRRYIYLTDKNTQLKKELENVKEAMVNFMAKER